MCLFHYCSKIYEHVGIFEATKNKRNKNKSKIKPCQCMLHGTWCVCIDVDEDVKIINKQINKIN